MFLNAKQAERRLKSEKNLARAAFLPHIAKNPEGALETALETIQEIQGIEIQETFIDECEQISTQITEKIIPLSGKNRVNLTREERTEIAIEARLGKSQTEIARERSINNLTVHNIAHGKTKGIDEDKVESAINEVKDLALQRLMTSLGLLTDDKLSGCSAKDLSVIASNMGRVVEKVSPKVEQPDNINFVIYAPELKQERAFETVEI